jgi:DNA (cytosine-5)-methyltransferase 1
MKHASLFSGIGGFDLAAEWMGWENVFHCEINPFGQQVLKHYWPNSILYDDITKTDFTIHRGNIDILTGGFPCQPYSAAGKRLGTEDDRHLWPSMLRAIREIQPTWVVGENVRGLTNWNGGLVFNEVQADLEAEGYSVQPFLLPAAGVGAPHERYRIWFVAYSDNARTEQQLRDNGNRTKENQGWEEQSFNEFGEISGNAAYNSIKGLERYARTSIQTESFRPSIFCEINNASNPGCSKRENGIHGKKQRREATKFGNSYTKFGRWAKFPSVEPTIRSRNDGLSSRLVGITFPKHRNESIKAYGNAVVPQVVHQIFKAIEQFNNKLKLQKNEPINK